MSASVSMKENIQGQDIVLKMFEKILKEKLDSILKEKSPYHPAMEFEKIKPDFCQK